MQAHADAEEGFAGGDVSADRGEIVGGGERGQTVGEMPYAGKYEFLSKKPCQREEITRSTLGWRVEVLMKNTIIHEGGGTKWP